MSSHLTGRRQPAQLSGMLCGHTAASNRQVNQLWQRLLGRPASESGRLRQGPQATPEAHHPHVAYAPTRSTRHATERAEIEVPISTDPYASVRNSSGARNDRRETIASRPETNSWRLSATLDVRGVKAMQPELYFYEQWLRERHADIQAAARAARLRPNMTEMPIDAPPSTNTRAQARKERVMRRLLRCGLALVLVMAALPTGDRTAHAADSILTEILRRGTVRIALVVVVPPLRFEDENGNLQGYEIDIANRLAKDLGVTIDWIKTKSVGRVAVLQT